MRSLFALLLAVLLSLNAAHAAVVGICDALEHTQNHGIHFGHHSHEHGDDHAPAAPDQPSQSPTAGDHHPAHVHPGFSLLLPGAIGVIVLDGHSPYASLNRRDFVSAPHIRLERPPRTTLA
jgi:hypothetical protein